MRICHFLNQGRSHCHLILHSLMLCDPISRTVCMYCTLHTGFKGRILKSYSKLEKTLLQFNSTRIWRRCTITVDHSVSGLVHRLGFKEEQNVSTPQLLSSACDRKQTQFLKCCVIFENEIIDKIQTLSNHCICYFSWVILNFVVCLTALTCLEDEELFCLGHVNDCQVVSCTFPCLLHQRQATCFSQLHISDGTSPKYILEFLRLAS